jgi:hypothetical protein
MQSSARKDLLSYVHDHHHLSSLFLSFPILLHRRKEFGKFSATLERGIAGVPSTEDLFFEVLGNVYNLILALSLIEPLILHRR